MVKGARGIARRLNELVHQFTEKKRARTCALVRAHTYRQGHAIGLEALEPYSLAAAEGFRRCASHALPIHVHVDRAELCAVSVWIPAAVPDAIDVCRHMVDGFGGHSQG